MDLLLLDGVRRWGNGRMLPLGDLREPMASAARASCLVVTRGSRADRAKVLDWWRRWGSGGPVFWLDFSIGALRRFGTGETLELPAPPRAPCSPSAAWATRRAFYADLLVAGLPWTGTWSLPRPPGSRPRASCSASRTPPGPRAPRAWCAPKRTR